MEFGETVGVSIISALITGYLAYFFGFRQYLKQKTREETRRYYIKDGIDKVISVLNESSFLCYFNFGKAMRIIEYLEKSLMDRNLGRKEIEKIFSEMQTSIVAPPAELYKIQLLTDQHKDLFSWITEALGDYSKYLEYLRHELFLDVNLYFRYPEKLEGEEREFFEKLKERTINIYNDISRHEPLKVHLLNLRIRIDEIGISSMKDFDKKVLKDKKMKEILAKVKEDYKKIQKDERNKSEE